MLNHLFSCTLVVLSCSDYCSNCVIVRFIGKWSLFRPEEGSIHFLKHISSDFPFGQSKHKHCSNSKPHKRGNLKVNKWARWDDQHSQIRSINSFPMDLAHHFNTGLGFISQRLIHLVMTLWFIAAPWFDIFFFKESKEQTGWDYNASLGTLWGATVALIIYRCRERTLCHFSDTV